MDLGKLFDELDKFIIGLDKEARRFDAEGDGFRAEKNVQKSSYYYGLSSGYRFIIGSLSFLAARLRAEYGIPVDPSWREHVKYGDDEEDPADGDGPGEDQCDLQSD